MKLYMVEVKHYPTLGLWSSNTYSAKGNKAPEPEIETRKGMTIYRAWFSNPVEAEEYKAKLLKKLSRSE